MSELGNLLLDMDRLTCTKGTSSCEIRCLQQVRQCSRSAVVAEIFVA